MEDTHRKLTQEQVLERLKASPLEVRDERLSGAGRRLSDTAPRALILPTAWRVDR